MFALAATSDENTPPPTEPFARLVRPLQSAPSHGIEKSSLTRAFGPANALLILKFGICCIADKWGYRHDRTNDICNR
jgi:hypothetical protein